jgi:predicted RNase H-like HicB family nuclease
MVVKPETWGSSMHDDIYRSLAGSHSWYGRSGLLSFHLPSRKKSSDAHQSSKGVVFTVEFDREEDGRWIAEVPELAGVMVYGQSKKDALIKVQALAYRVLADRIEAEGAPQPEVRFTVA